MWIVRAASKVCGRPVRFYHKSAGWAASFVRTFPKCSRGCAGCTGEIRSRPVSPGLPLVAPFLPSESVCSTPKRSPGIDHATGGSARALVDVARLPRPRQRKEHTRPARSSDGNFSLRPGPHYPEGRRGRSRLRIVWSCRDLSSRDAPGWLGLRTDEPETDELGGRVLLGLRWARLDSNQGPTDYESAALTS